VWVEDRDSIGESRAFAQNVLADECPPPTATFTTSLTGLNANLVCTTPDATTASWQFSDNTTGTGLTVNHTFPSTGMWIITLTVTNDCGTDVLIDTIYITSVGIENPESKRETFVFPNPADDQFTIQYTLTSPIENLGISIYNAGGQRVTALKDLPCMEGLNTAVMDCSGLAEGVYQCVLRTGKKIRSERFVIIR
jgi:PKD repeat protein